MLPWLPGEVIGLIVEVFAPSRRRLGMYRPELKFDRRQLSACTLVCRDWARLARPLAFTELILRASADVAQLLAFGACHTLTAPPLFECLEYLIIEAPDPTTYPWIHRLLTAGCFAHCTFWITLGGVSDAPNSQSVTGKATPQWDGQHVDMVRTLPRTLPPSLFAGVTMFSVRGCRFTCLDDIVGPLRSLRQIDYVRCAEVTFAPDFAVPAIMTQRRCPFVAIETADCDGFASVVEAIRLAFCVRVEQQSGVPFAIWETVVGALLVPGHPFSSVNFEKGAEMILSGNQQGLKMKYQADRHFLLNFWGVDEHGEGLAGKCGWAMIDTTLTSLNIGQIPYVDIIVDHPASFSRLMVVLGEGGGPSTLHAMNRLSIVLNRNYEEVLTLEQTLSAKLVVDVDGTEITLTCPQWVEYQWAKTKEARGEYLRQLKEALHPFIQPSPVSSD